MRITITLRALNLPHASPRHRRWGVYVRLRTSLSAGHGRKCNGRLSPRQYVSVRYEGFIQLSKGGYDDARYSMARVRGFLSLLAVFVPVGLAKGGSDNEGEHESRVGVYLDVSM